MKISRWSSMLHILGGLLLALPAGATRDSNPLEKIVGVLTRLQGQLVQDGETESKAYADYTGYCQDASFNKKEEITSAKSEKDLLEAAIAKASSDIKTSEGKIEDGAAAVAENEAKLKSAKQVRAKEEGTFEASEKELMSAIDMLGRAVEILDKEMQKGGASLLQSSAATQQLENVVMGLGAVIEGASLGGSEDLQKLTAMLQTSQDSDDGNQNSQEPEKAYDHKSGSIIEVLEDLKDKAQTQLREIRIGEEKSIQNFEMLVQALEDENKQFNKELEAEKKAKSEAEKTKAVAQGNLEITSKELAQASKDLEEIQQDCMQKAADHEATVAGRNQEMKTLVQAKKIVQGQMMGGAAFLQQDDDESFSFLQNFKKNSKKSSKALLKRRKLAGQHVVALVQRLADQQKSASLQQLASRISVVMKYAQGHKDPFVKVKNLLSEMIKKLTREQNQDSSEKEYCDREMKKTKANHDELADEAEDLKAKIDQAAAASTKLKSQVKDLQWELSTLEKLMTEQSKARREAHEVFLKDKDDISKGLNAIRSAIHVLRDYYAADKGDSFLQTDSESDSEDSDSDTDTDASSDADTSSDKGTQPEPPEKFEKSSGAGQGIIEMLEVVESDLAKNLAELQTEEDDAQSAYEKEVQEYKVTKAEKDQDVSYNTKEYTSLDKAVSELSSDAATNAEEFAAVKEYFAKVKDRCVAKPDKYEDRKARREQEIKGLEEALSILESEGAAFLQRRK